MKSRMPAGSTRAAARSASRTHTSGSAMRETSFHPRHDHRIPIPAIVIKDLVA